MQLGHTSENNNEPAHHSVVTEITLGDRRLAAEASRSNAASAVRPGSAAGMQSSTRVTKLQTGYVTAAGCKMQQQANVELGPYEARSGQSLSSQALGRIVEERRAEYSRLFPHLKSRDRATQRRKDLAVNVGSWARLRVRWCSTVGMWSLYGR